MGESILLVLFSTMLGEFSLFLDLSGLRFPICGAQSTVQSCPFPPQTLPFVNRRTGKAFTAESHFLSVPFRLGVFPFQLLHVAHCTKSRLTCQCPGWEPGSSVVGLVGQGLWLWEAMGRGALQAWPCPWLSGLNRNLFSTC